MNQEVVYQRVKVHGCGTQACNIKLRLQGSVIKHGTCAGMMKIGKKEKKR